MKSHNGTSDSAPSTVQGWHQLDWSTIYQAVRKTQLQIAQATRENNWRRVGRLQRLLTRSFYGRCWAVKRVTENRGRKTPGVDGYTWDTPKAKWNAVSKLSNTRGYRPKTATASMDTEARQIGKASAGYSHDAGPGHAGVIPAGTGTGCRNDQ
jgi:RNA-directed DNA polymerase